MAAVQVSIIIVNYNTFEITANCVQSIIDYVKGVSYEIVIVDNCSTDINPEEFSIRFSSIQLIKSSVNVGFAKGNNLGIKKSTGEYILLLNSDTLLQDDAVTTVFQFLKNHEQVAVASARLQYADGRTQHNCQRFPSVRTKLFELFRLQKITGKRGGRVLYGSFFDYSTLAYPDWVWGTFFLFKRSRLQNFSDGKLPDDFFMYGEDMQWCYEFRRQGYTIAFVPNATVTHLMGKSGGQASQWIKENHQKFLDMYYSRFHQKLLKWLDGLLKITNGY